MAYNKNNHIDLPLRPDDDNDYQHIGEKVNFNGEEYYLYGVNTLAEAKGYERIRIGRHASIPDHNSFEVRTDKLDPPIIERGSRNRKTPVRINPSPPDNTLPSSNAAQPKFKKVKWSQNGEKLNNSNNNNLRGRSKTSIPFNSPVAAINIPVTPVTHRRTPPSDSGDNDNDDDDSVDDDDDYNNKTRNHSETLLSTIQKRKGLYERFYECRRELELGSISMLSSSLCLIIKACDNKIRYIFIHILWITRTILC